MVRATRSRRSVPRPLSRSRSASSIARRASIGPSRQIARRRRPRTRPFGASGLRARLAAPGGRDPLRDDRAGLGLRAADEQGRRDAVHRDPEVDPVAQRPGDPAPVALGDARRARAGVAGGPAHAARARVHGRDEGEPGRERRRAADADHRHGAVLERLPQRLEHVAPELRQLVAHQDPLVGQGHLPGRQARAAADHPGVGHGVMRAIARAAAGPAPGPARRPPPRRRPSPPAPPRRRGPAAASGSSGRAASCRRPAARPGASRDRPRARSRAPAGPAPGRARPRGRPPGRPRARGPRARTVARAPRPAASTPRPSARGSGTGTARRIRRDRTTSAASASVATPTASSPGTSRASSSAAAGTSTRRIPAASSARPIGSTPGHRAHLAAEPELADQRHATRPRRAAAPTRAGSRRRSRGPATRPALRSSAGARLTVIRRGGWW